MFFAVILSWAAAGLVVGFIASKVVNLRGDDPRLGIFAGAIAAVVTGVVWSMVSGTSIGVWTLWGNLYAAIGALVAVVAWHAIRSRTITHEKFTARRSY